jgi:hypothetical protein
MQGEQGVYTHTHTHTHEGEKITSNHAQQCAPVSLHVHEYLTHKLERKEGHLYTCQGKINLGHRVPIINT